MQGKLARAWLVSRAQAFLESKALYVASKYQFADYLKSGPLSTAEIAARAGTDADTTDRFLKYLSVKGVFRRVSEGVYENTPTSEYLRSDHPQTVRPIMMNLDFVARAATGFAEAVRDPKVKPYQAAFNTQTPFWDFFAQQKEEQGYFDQAMASWGEMQLPALLADYDWAKHGRATLVDVGGGFGHLTAALLRVLPFTGVVFDYNVNGFDYWRKHYSDVVSRASFVQGSFFESVSLGGDLYVLRHVLHDWPDPEAVEILRKVAAAMQETKRSDPSKRPLALVVEGLYDFPPADPQTPETDLMMLIVRGKERSRSEFARLCGAAGLKVAAVVPGTLKDAVIEAELAS